MDDVEIGFIHSIMKRMEDLSTSNLPGKQILDSYPFLQSLPEFITPYKKKWRRAREEGHKFWLGLIEQVEERVAKGEAMDSFAKTCLELKAKGELCIREEELVMLVGGIVGAGKSWEPFENVL